MLCVLCVCGGALTYMGVGVGAVSGSLSSCEFWRCEFFAFFAFFAVACSFLSSADNRSCNTSIAPSISTKSFARVQHRSSTGGDGVGSCDFFRDSSRSCDERPPPSDSNAAGNLDRAASIGSMSEAYDWLTRMFLKCTGTPHCGHLLSYTPGPASALSTHAKQNECPHGKEVGDVSVSSQILQCIFSLSFWTSRGIDGQKSSYSAIAAAEAIAAATDDRRRGAMDTATLVRSGVRESNHDF